MNEIITGGTPIEVQHLDGSTETVTIALLKIKQFPEYLQKLEDEEALAEFLCGKPEGWSQTLDVDTILKICEKGHDLNFKNACRWGQRRASINEGLLPIAEQGQKLSTRLPSSAPKPE